MRNVFERWGPILSPELRMACGSSTAAYCHETEINKIWDYYNNQGYEVADAFIFGLHRYDWNTPLCITTGKWQASSTPLFDQTFTNLPNPSGPFLHIQYLSAFEINVPMRIIDLPEMLPIFYMIPMPLPEIYRSYELIEEEEWIISKTILKERGIPLFRVNKNSGSIYAFGERSFDEESQVLKENEFMRLSDKFLTDQGWSEKSIRKPIGQKMMIESAPSDGYIDGKAKVVQKNVMIVYNRQIIIDGDTVNMVGEGGKIIVQLNNDGSVYNASKVWREIKGVKKTTKAKKYDQAYEEALEQVEARNEYELDSWTWGYEEFAGNVTQTELKAVYLFNFTPIDKENAVQYPPMVIKVSAHL
ncbi:hypothetical protein KA005_68185, partial [bacterium]|nr:hypothetical protein [bacterium]